MKTTNNTFNIMFHARKPRSKDQRVPIYARITINGKRIEVSVKQKIEAVNWNFKKGMCKGIKEEVKTMNSYLEQLRASVIADHKRLS